MMTITQPVQGAGWRAAGVMFAAGLRAAAGAACAPDAEAAVGLACGSGAGFSRASTCAQEADANAFAGHAGNFPVDCARSRASHRGGGIADGPTVSTMAVAAAAPNTAWPPGPGCAWPCVPATTSLQ